METHFRLSCSKLDKLRVDKLQNDYNKFQPLWRHQMETFSALLAGPLCGEFTGDRLNPLTKPVTRSFGVFFYLRLNKRLSKH